MMGKGLERDTGCLANLDLGQNAQSWCMQSNSTLHTYYLTTCLRQVHRVVYVALLGELCSRSDGQAPKRFDSALFFGQFSTLFFGTMGFCHVWLFFCLVFFTTSYLSWIYSRDCHLVISLPWCVLRLFERWFSILFWPPGHVYFLGT